MKRPPLCRVIFTLFLAKRTAAERRWCGAFRIWRMCGETMGFRTLFTSDSIAFRRSLNFFALHFFHPNYAFAAVFSLLHLSLACIVHRLLRNMHISRNKIPFPFCHIHLAVFGISSVRSERGRIANTFDGTSKKWWKKANQMSFNQQ